MGVDQAPTPIDVQSMSVIISATWPLFLGIALIMLANGLQGTLLGLRASLESFPTTITGLVMSSYYLGFLLGSRLSTRVVTQVGHIRTFAALASLASVSVLLHSVFVDPASWAVMRLFTGFSYAGLYVVAESWLNDRATNETRGQLLSIYMVVMYAGLASGQFMLNLADPAGYELFILSSVLVSLALIPMLVTVGAAPEITTPAPVGMRELFRISPLGVVGSVATGMTNGAFFGMGAVYAASIGLSVGEISLFMAATVVGGIALQWPIGRLSDLVDRRIVLAGVTIAAAACALAAVLFGGTSTMILLACVAAYGAASFPMYSLSIAHTNDRLDYDQIVPASGTLVLLGGIGAILGPVSASGAMALTGPAGFFWYLLVAHAALGAFTLFRMMRRAATPLEEQGRPVPLGIRPSPIAVAAAQAWAADEVEGAAEPELDLEPQRDGY